MSSIINADPYGKIAIQGYDPVAFHTEKQAMKGNPYIVADHQGYKYLFISEENKSLFLTTPDRFVPEFGGYCAFGVSLGVLFPVEIESWEIIDGKLVLQFNSEIKKKFEEEKQENLIRAKENWHRFELAGTMQ